MLKTAETREIVRATAAGQAALDPAMATRVVARATHTAPSSDNLTERDLEVLRLLLWPD
jgi:DNA-binding NarL/FixJ family response regulator